ncbi:YhgE/Pip family protein [Actinomycetes bacterium NPDC127524]
MKGYALQSNGLNGRKGWIIALIAVLLVPLVYAAIILTANWGPYDNLSKVPVAIVNHDEGGMSGDQPINVGSDLVADLKKNNSLGWDFVSSDEAARGLKDLKYYMVIEIPRDFSKNATTVLDENPKKPELRYTQNEGLHFMGAQVTKNAAATIHEQLDNQITKTYTKTLFAKLSDISSGFKDGADGSGKINAGAEELHKGTGKILSSLSEKAPDISLLADGSKELKSGTGELYRSLSGKQNDIAKLADGSRQVNDGTNTLLSSLKEKSSDISKLADGTQQLENGSGLLLKSLKNGSGSIGQLADGAKQVDGGAKKVAGGARDLAIGAGSLEAGSVLVLNGLKDAASGSTSLDSGLAKLEPGSKAVADGAGEVNKNAKALLAGAQSVAAGLEQLAEKVPGLKESPDFKKLLEGSKAVSGGLGQLAAKTPELKAGAEQVSTGIAAAKTGSKTLNGGLSDLVKGQTAVNAGAKKLSAGANTLSVGAGTLAAGTGTLAAGNETVNSSWKKVTDSVAAINGGISSVNKGNHTVKSGWKDMTSGVSTLANGTKQVADGNRTVKTGWSALTLGANKLDNGMLQVSNGTQSVKTGWDALTFGLKKVDNGVGQIESGSNELTTGLAGGAEQTGAIHAGDKNIEQFSAPVKLAGTAIHKFKAYRYANAPYILSLALFTGVLLLTLLFDLKLPENLEVSKFRFYGGKLGTMAMLSAAQAAIVSLFTLIFIHSNFMNGISMVLFSIFSSLAFLAIVFFLTVLAGNIGRFAGLAFLVLQLSITGSSLPIDMLPQGYQTLSRFLPLTYSIGGFKAVINLDNYASFWGNIAALAVFLVVFSLLTTAIVLFKRNKPAHAAKAAA